METMTPRELTRKVRQLDEDVKAIYDLLLSLDAKTTALTKRVDKHDPRFDTLEARFDTVDGKLDQVLELLGSR